MLQKLRPIMAISRVANLIEPYAPRGAGWYGNSLAARVYVPIKQLSSIRCIWERRPSPCDRPVIFGNLTSQRKHRAEVLTPRVHETEQNCVTRGRPKRRQVGEGAQDMIPDRCIHYMRSGGLPIWRLRLRRLRTSWRCIRRPAKSM